MAFLRGINVGGNHIIKMADLKRVLEENGLQRVQTYIQSGNLLFDADGDAGSLETLIEQTLFQAYGFSVPTMIRTAEQMEDIVRRCPFAFDELGEKESIHLSLLKSPPTPEEIAGIPDIDTGKDAYRIDGTEMFWFFSQSMLDSSLPKKLQRIGPATMRNWKTVLKMDELARGRK